MPSYRDLLHRPQWLASQYDPYHYINAYNTTPTKEKPPVTSSTLNDMTVAELEALAERTANTLREKKAKNLVKFTQSGYDYTFDRNRQTLYKHSMMVSVFQPVIDAARSLGSGLSADNCRDLAAIFTAITPKN